MKVFPILLKSRRKEVKDVKWIDCAKLLTAEFELEIRYDLTYLIYVST